MKLEALYIGKLFYFINVKISYIAVFGNQKLLMQLAKFGISVLNFRQEILSCSVLICN